MRTRDGRVGKFCVVVGALALLVTGLAAPAAAETQGSAVLTATSDYEPNFELTELRNYDVIHVTGSGFQPQEEVKLVQGCGFIGGLDEQTALTPQADGAGNFVYDYPVSRYLWVPTGPEHVFYVGVDQGDLDISNLDNLCFLAAFPEATPLSSPEGNSWFVQFEQDDVEPAVTVTSPASVSKTSGRVTLTGTQTCDPDSGQQTSVSGSLWQRVGRKSVATGTFQTEPVFCSEGQAWSVVVDPTGVPFAQGTAELTVAQTRVNYRFSVTDPSQTILIELKVPKTSKK
jgi:hypothetical protein